MESSIFHRLEELNQSTTSWKIKVRVTRMWPTINSESGSLKGYNLILLDDDNNHIHAFAYHNIWNGLKTPINEGGVYVIEQFLVKDASGTLKPVQTSICIRFTNYTSVKSVNDDGVIPAYKFEFLDLGDLYGEASKYQAQQQPEFAIDLIGVLEEFEPLAKIDTKYGVRDIVKFRLCDSSNDLKVSVWGDLAVFADKIYRKELQTPVIAILTNTKVTTFMNYVQIGTLPSSKIYLNLDDDTVTDMRLRLKEEGYQPKRDRIIAAPKTEVVPNFMEKITLKDLNEKLTYDLLKKKIYCTFTVIKVEEEPIWWIYSCNKCHHEVEELHRKFRCNNCPRTIPVAPKRFRIMVLAEDDTFSCNVILMDRAARRILGTSAAKAYNDFEKDPEKGLPQILKNLVGREITVILMLSKSNVVDDSTMFLADDIFDITMAVPSPSESPPVSTSSTVDLSITSLEVDDTEQTPGSAKSVTKKIKTEV